jgi:hypothetical protein
MEGSSECVSCGSKQIDETLTSELPMCTKCHEFNRKKLNQYNESRVELFPSFNRILDNMYLGNEDTARL